MTATLAQIWRHPIKSHGREALERVELTAHRTMPWDRTWAVAHEAARMDGTAWAPCANFSRVSRAPRLMAMEATLDEATGHVTLRHPDRPDLTFDPDGDPAAFLAWVAPLMPTGRAASVRIVRVPSRGMTDSDFPSLTLAGLSAHRDLERHMGRDLSPLRWRANLLIEGIDPWAEFGWVGREIAIGAVRLRVVERTERCLATATNPATGLRDADTLGALNALGHRDFGVRAEVVAGGTIRCGDPVVTG